MRPCPPIDPATRASSRRAWLLAAAACATLSLAMPAGGRELSDQAGRRVRLPDGPLRKIGTPGISMASMAIAVGGAASLAAVTPEVARTPWLQRVAPRVAALPTPFSRPAGVNLEALLAVRPDLVLLWQGSLPLAQRIESLGIPVLTMGYATPDEWVQAVRLLGAALGGAAPARAASLVQDLREQQALLARGLQGLDAAQKPRVYYASILPQMTEGAGSMIDAWISAAGGVNVAARAGIRESVTVQLEDVLAWDPQHIVVQEPGVRETMLTDMRWRRLRAVNEGRVVLNPRGVNTWCTRAAEIVLQLPWAARLLHPQRFAALDLAPIVRRFHERYYDYRLGDDEVARMLDGRPPPAT